MAVTKKSGKAGSMTIASTAIPVTQWTAEVAVDLHDTTDTNSYDSGTSQAWKEQVVGSASMSGSFEGHFDYTATTGTSDKIIDNLFPGTTVAATFKVDATTTFASCNIQLENCTVTMDTASTVKISGSYKSTGVVTF